MLCLVLIEPLSSFAASALLYALQMRSESSILQSQEAKMCRKTYDTFCFLPIPLFHTITFYIPHTDIIPIFSPSYSSLLNIIPIFTVPYGYHPPLQPLADHSPPVIVCPVSLHFVDYSRVGSYGLPMRHCHHHSFHHHSLPHH